MSSISSRGRKRKSINYKEIEDGIDAYYNDYIDTTTLGNNHQSDNDISDSEIPVMDAQDDDIDDECNDPLTNMRSSQGEDLQFPNLNEVQKVCITYSFPKSNITINTENSLHCLQPNFI